MPAMHTKRNYWIVHTAYWTVCETHNIFLASYFGAKLEDIYLAPMVEFIILFIGTHLFGVFVSRYTFVKDWKIVLFLGLGVCLLLSGIATFLHIYFFGSILTPHLFMGSNIPFWLFMYLNCLWYIYPWFGVFYILGLIRANFKIIKKQNETNMSLQLAQLENLKSQLNPHFLFNSLNSIKSLTLSNVFLAREAIIELAELLRTSLDFKNVPEIFLYQEIELVEKYLMLEKIRFEERLNYSVDMSSEVLSVKIPPMAIQLLVENAIKHGINNSKKGGYIAISGYIKNGILLDK
jgi:sensor histidine kinase YesM